MISLATAQELKEAGLVWRASVNDFFAIPERDLDERVFVVADMMANLDIFRGWPVVTFHGAAEWALDYILTAETVWMPTENQLRRELVTLLKERGTEAFALALEDGLYRLNFTLAGEPTSYQAEQAEDVYAAALLRILQSHKEDTGRASA